MRLRDGLLLAPILLVGVMLATIVLFPIDLQSWAIWAITAVSGVSIGTYLALERTPPREGPAARRQPENPSPRDPAGWP